MGLHEVSDEQIILHMRRQRQQCCRRILHRRSKV
nr:MAG TPA: hypothetical protein [Caudoviricetes sp.]